MGGRGPSIDPRRPAAGEPYDALRDRLKDADVVETRAQIAELQAELREIARQRDTGVKAGRRRPR